MGDNILRKVCMICKEVQEGNTDEITHTICFPCLRKRHPENAEAIIEEIEKSKKEKEEKRND